MTDTQQVFAAWMTTQQGRNLKLTNDRRDKIKARLNEGFTVEDLCDAVRGWVYDDWEERKRYSDIPTLLKTGSTTEKWRDLYRSRQERKPRLSTANKREWFLAMAKTTMENWGIDDPELVRDLESCEEPSSIVGIFTRATGLTLTGERL
jgi:hypothetical protein